MTDDTTLLKIDKIKLAKYIIKYGPIKLSVDTGKSIEMYEVCAVDVRDVATPIAAIDNEGKRKWCISASLSIPTKYRFWNKKEAIAIFNSKNLIFRLKGSNIPLKLTSETGKDFKVNQYISDSYLESLARDMEYSVEPKKWLKCGEQYTQDEYNIDEELEKYIGKATEKEHN